MNLPTSSLFAAHGEMEPYMARTIDEFLFYRFSQELWNALSPPSWVFLRTKNDIPEDVGTEVQQAAMRAVYDWLFSGQSLYNFSLGDEHSVGIAGLMQLHIVQPLFPTEVEIRPIFIRSGCAQYHQACWDNILVLENRRAPTPPPLTTTLVSADQLVMKQAKLLRHHWRNLSIQSNHTWWTMDKVFYQKDNVTVVTRKKVVSRHPCVLILLNEEPAKPLWTYFKNMLQWPDSVPYSPGKMFGIPFPPSVKFDKKTTDPVLIELESYWSVLPL